MGNRSLQPFILKIEKFNKLGGGRPPPIRTTQDGLPTDVMQIYRYSDGVLANTALLLYIFIGGTISVFLLSGVSESAIAVALSITIIATLLFAHLMILAAYLVHECMLGRFAERFDSAATINVAAGA